MKRPGVATFWMKKISQWICLAFLCMFTMTDDGGAGRVVIDSELDRDV